MILKDIYNRQVGDKESAKYINNLYSDTKARYLKYHKDWYINERFFRGEHWVVFNNSLNKVQTIPVQQGEIRRTVNKIRSQIRGVKNFIKRNQPRWQVAPIGITDEDLQTAQKTNMILQNLYRTTDIKSIMTDVIMSGLKFSMGIMEGGIIRQGKETKIKFWHDDTFDIFFDPFASNIQDCRYIIKAFKKPLQSVKDNPSYTIRGSLTPETSQRGYKELLEKEKYEADPSSSKDLEGIMVKELWTKTLDKQGNVKIKVFTVAGNQLIRVFEPPYRRYPFFGFNPERSAGSIYSDAWIKDLISTNKSLDKTTSQIEAYIQRMLAGKYLIKQGVEVSTITDKGAEKIYYKGSTPPYQMNLQPLPSTPFVHMQNQERWIEEMGGIREASLGRLPTGAQSGSAIEALQAADAQTVAEPIENLQQFLEQAGTFILELIEDNQSFSETLIENNQQIKYIGRSNVIPKETLQITSSEVKVVIVPEVAYSEEAKFNRLLQMAQAGLVDNQTLLEQLSLSNVSDVILRMNKEKEEKYKQEMVKQAESHRSSGQAPEDTADLADQENKQMALGQSVNLTPKALWSPEHLQLHMSFIEENQDVYNNNKDLFDEHIINEEQYE